MTAPAPNAGDDWLDGLLGEHPVERCDLFRTTTGGCTCDSGVVRDPLPLADAREKLRQEMLRQPNTDGRDTYGDGYGQGLARAIDIFDAALSEVPMLPPVHRDRVTGRAASAYTPPEDIECRADESLARAWDEGARAFSNGRGSDANPYRKWTR